MPLVYDESRKLAEQKMAQENLAQTLSPMTLVHETYVRRPILSRCCNRACMWPDDAGFLRVPGGE